MNIKSLVIASALAGGLFCSASAITTVTPGQITNFVAPVPASVVSPTDLPPSLKGATVILRLTVDAAGNPSNIKIVRGDSEALRRNLVSAVSQWKFKPALKNGVPVATQIELPLQLVEG
jgi:TonB family protein